jgi:hypothetical protein
MFGSPQDIMAILVGGVLVIGAGSAIVRNNFIKPKARPETEPMEKPEPDKP